MRSIRPWVLLLTSGFLFSVSPGLLAQRELGRQVRPYVKWDADRLALTGVRLIDGTGAPARENQTILIDQGRIAAVGAAASITIPADAERIELPGKTLFPGWVMLHEHLFYPVGAANYNPQAYSFPRLYLAGGATTIRTGGSMFPYLDLRLAEAIEKGNVPGPRMNVTGPYLNAPGLSILGVKNLRGPDDAREMVRYWAQEGVDSFKAYMHITREELKAAIEEAHKRNLKVTGHLCSITLADAAELGIDNVEHGFVYATDFAEGKQPDRCPSSRQRIGGLLNTDPKGPRAQALYKTLIDHDVAVTSTLTVFEISVPGRPRLPDRVLDLLAVETRDLYLRTWSRIASQADSPSGKLFPRAMAFEKAFVEAGGWLVSGTDPTGYGGVIPGHANLRQVQLLVEAGFSLEEAVKISTLNGARYLGLDGDLGTVEVGKRADLVVVDGNPLEDTAAIQNVQWVFKDGIGYDSQALFESARGLVGLR